MKIELKSLVIGLVLGISIFLMSGLRGDPDTTTIGEKFLVKDRAGHAVLIDPKTAKAVRVEYLSKNPPVDALELSDCFGRY